MHPSVPICLVFIGCCSNVVFLEFLISEFPGSGNIITFSQFLFIAAEGFLFTSNFGRKRPVIPITKYAVMVAMFFVVQVVNNYALNFNVPMPLHMIFRAGSLIANLILGVIILKRSYNLSKYLSVATITLGIVICTIVSSQTKEPKHDEEEKSEVLRSMIGIAMLTFAVFMSARMGIYQETIYKEHGKHPSEALYYNHMLTLPAFLFLAGDIYHHAQLFSQTDLVPLPFISIPKMWLYLLGNVVTQYICIRSVFILTTECTSLTVTLVVTLRKFVSLIFSIYYFQNPFTVYHWLGTVMVFGGTLVFTEAFIHLGKMLKKSKAE